MPAQHWPFTWASFKQVWLLLVHIMQNLSKGYVHEDLPTADRCGCPIPGNIQSFSSHIQVGWGSDIQIYLKMCWLIAEGLDFTGPFQPKPFWDSVVLPSQIVATLDGLFAAIAPVPSALQLNEIKTSFDMYKQYCRLMVFLHHIWWSRLGDFKYNSLANCASGNWVLMYFYVTVHIESYLFAAKECQLYISLLFHFLNYWAVSVYILPSFLQFSVHQWTPRQPPKTPKIPPNFKYRCLNVFLSKI